MSKQSEAIFILGSAILLIGGGTWLLLIYVEKIDTVKADNEIIDSIIQYDIICWQGIQYRSYFGNEIELWMTDQIPELNGFQMVVMNVTGC